MTGMVTIIITIGAIGTIGTNGCLLSPASKWARIHEFVLLALDARRIDLAGSRIAKREHGEILKSDGGFNDRTS